MTDEPLPETLTAEIDALLDDAGVHDDRRLVTRMIRTSIGLGEDDADRLDLKIASAALAEMRDAFRLFAPFRGVPKVSVFGSARTQQDDPLYLQARDIAAALAADRWMVVTGAGPGIMQAAAEGRQAPNSRSGCPSACRSRRRRTASSRVRARSSR